MDDKKFKLDRSAFKMQTFEEAGNTMEYWRSKTVTERLEAAAYLIKSAYGLLGKPWPKMDKTCFHARKFDEAYINAITFESNDVPIRVIHMNQLLQAKKAANRLKDQNDIQQLESRNH